VTAVINVPSSLDDQTFEQVLEQLAPLPPDAKILIDARYTTWASPYGLTMLLTLAQTRQEKPLFSGPERDDTASYWSRANFYRYAEELFEMHGKVPPARPAGESGTLLEVTPVSKSDDVHTVVERIQTKAAAIITNNLHLESRAVMGFAMTLSEACQNIVEHAGRGGWVAVQNYNYKKRLGRHVVQIAVCDAGVGIRQSLESGNRRPLTDRWDDGQALETAVIQGTSRFPDHGRGQGFKGIRGYLRKWKGKLAVRSGTARVADVPEWDDDVVRKDRLAPMPGTQLLIMIPEKVDR
jgi:anti-sigma regulatory factor (Ser/Thr protein kinase)